ncbi:MAG: hypothetical protein IKC32_06750 [Clostridia bacterium]|nr:hypothetical protein [Clostridia bacterium]
MKKSILRILIAALILSLALIALSSCDILSSILGGGPDDGVHEHSFGEWEITREPSCTEVGEKTRTCSGCEETETMKIPVIDHTLGEYISDGNATCTSDGTKTAHCTQKNCPYEETVLDEGSKLPHSGGIVTCVTKANCDVCGEPYGELDPDAHASNGTKLVSTGAEKHEERYLCCGAVKAEAAHEWGEPTLDEAESVNVYKCECGEEKKVALEGHRHSVSFTAAKAATCTEAGNIAYYLCSSCGKAYTDEALTAEVALADTVIAAAHSSVSFIAAKAATCTEAGNIAYYLCSGCGKAYTDEALTAEVALAETVIAAAHSSVSFIAAKAATCTEAGNIAYYLCSGCGKAYTDEALTAEVALTDTVIAAAHSSVSFIAAKAATCTEAGNIAYYLCSGCGKAYTDEALTAEVALADTVIAAAHSGEANVYAPVDSDPDHHEVRYSCCGTLYKTEAHNYVATSASAADCDSPTVVTFECSGCKKSVSETDGDPLGHRVVVWRANGEAPISGETCKFTVTYVGSCSVCGEIDTKEETVVRHKTSAVISTPATCTTPGVKSYTCAFGCDLGEAARVSYTNASAHAWGEPTEENGALVYTCTLCSETKRTVVFEENSASVGVGTLDGTEIALGDISLSLDSALVGKLDSASEVALGARALTDSELEAALSGLSEAERAAVVGAVYSFTMTQGGAGVVFDGGKVTVTVPYTLTGDVDADRLAVWYLTSDGAIESVKAYYHDNTLSFTVSHFSDYAPVVLPEADACEIYGHNFSRTEYGATCTEPGYTVLTCARCGAVDMGEIILPLGHMLSAGVGTAPTCSAPGSYTYSCERGECKHVVTMEVARLEHSYTTISYVEATCETEGTTTEKCSVCGYTRTRTIAPHGHYFGSATAELKPGATSCLDGVIIYQLCGNYGCNAKIFKEELHEHVSFDKYVTSEGNYFEGERKKIYLKDYLDFSSHPFFDPNAEGPYFEVQDGCMCGAFVSNVYFAPDYSIFQMGGELYASSHSMPNPGDDYFYTANSEYAEMGPMMPSQIYTVALRAYSVKDSDCTVRGYAEICIGYDPSTGTSVKTFTYQLGESKWHSNIKTTATLVEEGLTCYEASLKYNFEGIKVVETCLDCGQVTSERFESVSSSGSHYWVATDEKYQYNPTSTRGGNHTITFTKRVCPCGESDYYIYKPSCYWGRIYDATLPDGTAVKIYACTWGCNFAYAVHEQQITANCRDTKTVTYYININEETLEYDKALTFNAFDYDYHRKSERVETKTPTGNPCEYLVEYKDICVECGEVSRSGSYKTTYHDMEELVVISPSGITTLTSSCKNEGCFTRSEEIRDANGRILREYGSYFDYANGVVVTTLSVYGFVTPEMYECLFERTERRDPESGELISFYQTETSIVFGGPEGCVRIQKSVGSNGERSEYQQNICREGESVHSSGSCTQPGFDGYRCTVCDQIRYYWFDYPYGHDLQCSEMDEYGTPIGYSCMRCGYYSTTEWTYTDIEVLYSENNYVIGYFNKGYEGGLKGETSLYAFIDGEEPVTLSVALTDDGRSKLYVSKADVEEALIAALGDAWQNYSVFFSLTVNGSTQTLKLA